MGGQKGSHVDRYHNAPLKGPEKARDSMTAEEECVDPDLGVVNACNTNPNLYVFWPEVWRFGRSLRPSVDPDWHYFFYPSPVRFAWLAACDM